MRMRGRRRRGWVLSSLTHRASHSHAHAHSHPSSCSSTSHHRRRRSSTPLLRRWHLTLLDRQLITLHLLLHRCLSVSFRQSELAARILRVDPHVEDTSLPRVAVIHFDRFDGVLGALYSKSEVSTGEVGSSASHERRRGQLRNHENDHQTE